LSRPPIYNAFTLLSPNHHSHGYWRTHEGQAQYGYKDLDAQIATAATLERGRFDAIFIADALGVPDLDQGEGTAMIKAGSQFPIHDPITIVSALGHATTDLGIAVTSSIIQDPPFSFARRISSLDHYTGGRVAWNIVTSYLGNAFRNYGFDGNVEHDERYVWAQEYADVTFKLWEHSWEDGAVLHDVETGRYYDPAKIHTIDHEGKRYKVQGPHLSEPSPQRTPVLFQAGSSIAGRAFAVRNAELTFLPSLSPAAARSDIALLDEAAREAGRLPAALAKIAPLSTVIGSTEEEARRKQAHLRESVDFEALQAFWSSQIGIDLAAIDPGTPLAELARRAETSNHGQFVETVFRAAAEAQDDPTTATWGEYLLDSALIPGKFAGTPEQIADHIEEFVSVGVDGFNVVPVSTLGWWDEWVDHVVPVLQERGLAQREYTPGTLRHKLFGNGDGIDSSHRAHQLGRTPAAV
jgi:FMN-dependent oxidoreductase (nitrilotriacetate monooxygenase family)